MKKIFTLLLLFTLLFTSCQDAPYDRYDVNQSDIVENGVAKISTSVFLFEDYTPGFNIGKEIYTTEVETTVDSISYYLNVEKEKADSYIETYKER